MAQQHYAIVTAITVAISEYTHRLIEICIIRVTKDRVLEEFTTLVNPRCLVPQEVTERTGIDQKAVRFEPVFCEVAAEIVELLKGAILVSHKDDFAYRTLRSEFKNIGYKLSSPTLSFTQLATKAFPNSSFSNIEDVYHHFAIPCENLNRARGKGEATVALFSKLCSDVFKMEDAIPCYKEPFAQQQKMEALNLDALERNPGVYYFKDKSDTIIYIGKAVRLRDRVRSHFNTKTEREIELCSKTSNIDFLYTGSNLLAELLESDEIANHKPEFNSAQKKETTPFIIVSKEHKSGYLHLSIIRKNYSDSVNEVFYNRSSVIEKLMEVCAKFNLCPKFCGFHRIRGKCNHDTVKGCPEACIKEEPFDTYNHRVHQALEFLNTDLKNFAIKQHGRKNGEVGFVLVRNGVYLGYGFVGLNDQIASPDDFENYITRKTHSYHTTRIIESYIRKPQNKSRIVAIDQETYRHL